MIQSATLLCDICGQPLPDDEMKKEMALFGVERACWKCRQPIPKERRLTRRLTDPCRSCNWNRLRKAEWGGKINKCGLPKDRPMCGQGEDERIPSQWTPKNRSRKS